MVTEAVAATGRATGKSGGAAGAASKSASKSDASWDEAGALVRTGQQQREDGDVDAAAASFTRARSLLEACFETGSGDALAGSTPLTLSCEYARATYLLAGAERKRGRVDEAIALYACSVRAFELPDMPAVASAADSGGGASLNPKAMSPGKRRALLASAANDLGVAHYQRGHLEGALAHFTKAMEVRREVLGVAHPDYASSSANVATVLTSLGRSAEAAAIQRSLEHPRAPVTPI